MANNFSKPTFQTVRGAKVARILTGAATSRGLEQGSALGTVTGLGTVVGMKIPDGALGNLVRFNVSIDDSSYCQLKATDGDPVEVTITGDNYFVPLEAADFHAWDFVQVNTVNGAGVDVNQTGDMDFVLVVVRV